jgi:lauroyl/myristoyl acyltransferase
LTELVEIRGKEHINDALSAGKGAIIGGAHFGSPSNCFALLGALGFPITVVAGWSFNPPQAHGSRAEVGSCSFDQLGGHLE